MAHRHGIRFRPAWEVLGERFDYSVNGEKPAGTATRVIFENTRGNLRIVGSDTQDVKVTGRKTIQAFHKSDADTANDSSPLEIVAQGDQIVVRTNQDHASGKQRISEDLEVTIPARMNIEAHGQFGDYDISEVDGTVELHCDRADVRL